MIFRLMQLGHPLQIVDAAPVVKRRDKGSHVAFGIALIVIGFWISMALPYT
jgi:hypothetical protein